MKLEEGGDLEGLLHPKDSILKSHLDLASKLTILKLISYSIREMHAGGVVHGDIKPHNVLRSEVGNPKSKVVLSDFGLSHEQAHNLRKSSMRATSTTKGTRPYCAPEMLAHKSNMYTIAKADFKTDVYAFGILAWEVMTGQIPFDEECKSFDEAMLKDRIHSIAPSNRHCLNQLPSETPLEVADMISKCWDADRSVRLDAYRCFDILNNALSIVNTEKFDVFFSHAYSDKVLLRHVVDWLRKLGYRVWYDDSDMGTNAPVSETKGIMNSTIVLTCVSSTYQSRPNCMFELREANRLKFNDKIIAILLKDIVDRNDTGRPHKRWMRSDVRIDRDLVDILKFDSKIYCNIASVAQDPHWHSVCSAVAVHSSSSGCSISSSSSSSGSSGSPELKERLRSLLQPLIRIMQDLGCVPSFRSDSI